MLVGLARMKKVRKHKRKKLKLLFIDVKKAHLNAKLEENEFAYVQLPAEADAESNKCGRLRRWLYGMRNAASSWEKEYA